MWTEIKTKESTLKFVTQQYEIGTYCIVNNDPSSQFGVSIEEDKFHIKIRKQTIKNNDEIISGTFIPFKSKININPFHND